MKRFSLKKNWNKKIQQWLNSPQKHNIMNGTASSKLKENKENHIMKIQAQYTKHEKNKVKEKNTQKLYAVQKVPQLGIH